MGVNAATEYADLSQRTEWHAMATMLAHAEPHIVLSKFGLTQSLPTNTAAQAKFRRPVPFAIVTTPVTEAVTPTAHGITYEDVEVVMAQFADLFEFSDWVSDLAEDPVIENASMLSGENLAATQEAVCEGVLIAGTNRFFSGGAARVNVDDTITLNMLRNVVRTLKSNKAKPVTRMLAGSTKIGTTPVEGAGYICFTHTDSEADIRDIVGFTPTVEYGQWAPLHDMEIGAVENVRFISSADLTIVPDAGGTAATNGMVSTSGTSVDIYQSIVIGQDAYAHVPVQGASTNLDVTVMRPQDRDKSDPLGQLGYVGWKRFYQAVILNEAWMAVMEHGVTDLTV